METVDLESDMTDGHFGRADIPTWRANRSSVAKGKHVFKAIVGIYIYIYIFNMECGFAP